MNDVKHNQPRLRLVTDSPTEPGDAALLARVASGDLAALGGVYDRYAPLLLRFARRLGARDDAEDVVQNVFVRVLRLAPTFDPRASSARPWLYAITVHVIQERRRSLRRFAAAMNALALQRNAPVHIATPKRSDLERCLQTLPLAKRSVVLLADIEGFTCD